MTTMPHLLLPAVVGHALNRKWACPPRLRSSNPPPRPSRAGLSLALEDGSMCACLCTCLLVACALLVAAFVFRYVVVRGKQCTSQARLGGKTVIVTGEFPLLWTPQNK